MSRAILQDIVGCTIETDYNNTKGFKTWGIVYNSSNSNTVCIAREDRYIYQSIEGRLVQKVLLNIGLRSKLQARYKVFSIVFVQC